ncbi:restriction endonuclease subunit S [Sphaerotilus sp.]|uniref:restriction endonuclease subunit S n=1 Tax=Sphaerotilus sp. TaxID=2093942 RepID=UPI00286D8A00|nr:restriction endonuclease subunit S [Sphaerotilus sp.]
MKNNEIPTGWAQAATSDICQFNPKTEIADEIICGFVPMQGLGTKFRARLMVEKRSWGEVKKAYTHFQTGDVLVAKVTPCFENGKAGIASGLPNYIGAGSSEFCVFRPFAGIDPRYLLGWFSTENFRQRATVSMTGSVGLKRVPKDVFLSEKLPLAPLAEQTRIADKLDTLLTRVDACRDRLARVAPLLKRFRQSVLAAATSGRLTADWRTAGANGWRKIRLGELGELGRGKSKHRPRNDLRLFGGAYPFIQTGDVANSNGCIERHSQTYSEFGLLQSKLWPADTLCITIAANIADTAVLSYPACFPDSVVGFVPDQSLCKVKYIKWSIDVLKDDIERLAPATAQKNINLGILDDVKINLPSIEEQTEIVRRVETLFAFADRLEARLKTAQTAADRLTPALLAKAFRGELVPQDPNDEPAAELLQRLAASRDAAPKAKRGRRSGATA